MSDNKHPYEIASRLYNQMRRSRVGTFLVVWGKGGSFIAMGSTSTNAGRYEAEGEQWRLVGNYRSSTVSISDMADDISYFMEDTLQKTVA